jgi:cytochrome c
MRSVERVMTMLFLLLLLAACEKRYEQAEVHEVTGGGDPMHGKQLIQQYGCQACHTIPGVKGPKGVVGPPLDRMAMRSYIAGKVPNTPQNMMTWIQNPQVLDPGNAMPALGVTPADARDITAYLFTLK